MERAINKTTGKLIAAFDIFKNGSYQNVDKGEWIAPKDSIYNWEDLQDKDEAVHYVREKKFENFKGTKIVTAPYFAVYPNSLAKTVEESPTHKLLKDWLFGRLQNDDIEILFAKGVKPHKYNNKYRLSELDINWNDYEIEVTTKGAKKLRADILLPFNKKHILLGEGIIFEIQISNQSENQTHERSIDRALHGYSVCWLFEKDFIIEEDNIQLKDNILLVNSFSEQMHFAKKEFVNKLKQVVEEQCRFLDDKIVETNLCIEELEKKKIEQLSIFKLQAEEIASQIMNRLSFRELNLLSKIEQLEQNPFKVLVESYKNEIEIAKNNLNIQSNITFNKLINKSNEIQKKLNYPLTFGLCPKCNHGFMTKKSGRFGMFYGCSNYPNCKHIINIKEDDNGEEV